MTRRDNAADSVMVRRKAQRDKDQAALSQADLAYLLKLPEFRRFAHRLMFIHGMLMKTPFNPSGSVMTLQVGMQEMARKVWAEIEEVDPESIPQMMTEYAQNMKAQTETLEALADAESNSWSV